MSNVNSIIDLIYFANLIKFDSEFLHQKIKKILIKKSSYLCEFPVNMSMAWLLCFYDSDTCTTILVNSFFSFDFDTFLYKKGVYTRAKEIRITEIIY